MKRIVKPPNLYIYFFFIGSPLYDKKKKQDSVININKTDLHPPWSIVVV